MRFPHFTPWAFIFSLSIFVGCQKPPSKEKLAVLPAPSDAITLLPGEHLAEVDRPFLITPSDIDKQWTASPNESQWRSSNLAPWMFIDSNNGLISGVPTIAEKITDIKVSYDYQGESRDLSPFSVVVASDPLYGDEWHLLNTEQQTFSKSPGTSNEDTHVVPVWRSGLSGKNILVGISDTAIQISHEDLYKNAYKGPHRDYVKGKSTSGYAGIPQITTDSDNFHGTGVAGIIGGVGWNNLGIRGMAPNVSIASLNFVDSDQSLNKMIDQVSGPYDIINQSWSATFDLPGIIESDYLNALRRATTSQRRGLGTLIVKAAGNGDVGGYSSENANQDPYNNNPFTIVVGALNAKGRKASYSSIGSSLWISAPGGEFGTTNPAILTTDLMGCSNGLSQSKSTRNDFDKGAVAANADCNYTSAFNGTSAASPMVSGALALLLERYPQLNWRDVKYLLAKSARRVDALAPPLVFTDNGVDIEFSLGWVQNSAGFYFSNEYGFGALDINSAISMAANHTPLPPASELTLINTTTLNQPFGTESVDHIESVVSSSFQKTIETIQINAQISHSYFGDISIEIVSPSGTRNLILTPFNSYKGVKDSQGQYVASTKTLSLLSNAFYGEPSSGQWKVIFYDQITGDEGKVINFNLKTFAY